MKTVLLIHGVFMPWIIMWPMAYRLKRLGYQVKIYNYPIFPDREDLSLRLVDHVNKHQPEVIIGHSLGGVIAVRNSKNFPSSVETVICLGSPLSGSKTAERILEGPLRVLLTHEVRHVLTRAVTIPENSPILFASFAGTDGRLGVHRLFPVLKGPHDGTVGQEETRVQNLSFWEKLHVGHTAFVFAREVVEKIHLLLRTRTVH